jgi:hypothetical protein
MVVLGRPSIVENQSWKIISAAKTAEPKSAALLLAAVDANLTHDRDVHRAASSPSVRTLRTRFVSLPYARKSPAERTARRAERADAVSPERL